MIYDENNINNVKKPEDYDNLSYGKRLTASIMEMKEKMC